MYFITAPDYINNASRGILFLCMSQWITQFHMDRVQHLCMLSQYVEVAKTVRALSHNPILLVVLVRIQPMFLWFCPYCPTYPKYPPNPSLPAHNLLKAQRKVKGRRISKLKDKPLFSFFYFSES